MEQLFTDTLATQRTETIIQHIQTDYFSLIVRELSPCFLLVEWEDVMENYQIQSREIEALNKAIQNYVVKNGPVFLLVKTFDGIIIDPQIQKKLQDNATYKGILAVAIELRSTTHRISLNLFAQFNRNRIPVRAFTSESTARKWLDRKQKSVNN